MPKTFGQLLSATRRRLDEIEAEGTWKNDELRGYLNDGAVDIARRSECLRAESIIDINAGTQNVTGPIDMVRIHTISWYRDSDTTSKYPLEYMDYRNLQSAAYTSLNVTEGTPGAYTTWNFPPNLSITCYPIPSDDGKLLVHYYKLPATLAEDSTQDAEYLDLPAGWEDAATDYAVYQAMLKDGDARWQNYMQMYEGKLAGLVEAAERFNDQAGMITAGHNMIPAWLYEFD